MADAGEYITGLFSAEDALLSSLREEADRTGLPPIAISADEGRLLQVLLAAIGARRVLEVGTLGGYSTICMGRALPPGGAGGSNRGSRRPGARRASLARRRAVRRHVHRRRQGAVADLLRVGTAAGA